MKEKKGKGKRRRKEGKKEGKSGEGTEGGEKPFCACDICKEVRKHLRVG